jgi:hypothetical protein
VGVDVVHEGEHVLLEAFVVLESQIDLDLILRGREVKRLAVECLSVAAEVGDELRDPLLE